MSNCRSIGDRAARSIERARAAVPVFAAASLAWFQRAHGQRRRRRSCSTTATSVHAFVAATVCTAAGFAAVRFQLRIEGKGNDCYLRETVAVPLAADVPLAEAVNRRFEDRLWSWSTLRSKNKTRDNYAGHW
jgi:hypothetical protein